MAEYAKNKDIENWNTEIDNFLDTDVEIFKWGGRKKVITEIGVMLIRLWFASRQNELCQLEIFSANCQINIANSPHIGKIGKNFHIENVYFELC